MNRSLSATKKRVPVHAQVLQLAVALIVLASVSETTARADMSGSAATERLALISSADDAWEAGDVEAQRRHLRRLIEVESELYGPNSDRVIYRHHELAFAELELENLDAARETMSRAHAMTAETHPEGSWQFEFTQQQLQYLDKLAVLPRSRRQFFLQTLRTRENAWEAGQSEFGLQADQAFVAAHTEEFGDRHPQTIHALLDLQDGLIVLRRTETVAGQLRRIEAILPQVTITPNPIECRLHLCWASLLELEGDAKSVEQRYKLAIETASRIDAPYLEHLALAHNNFAVVLVEQGRNDEAFEHYRAATRLWSNELSHHDLGFRRLHENARSLAYDLAMERVRSHEWDAAESLFEDAFEIAVAGFGIDSGFARQHRDDLEWLQRAREFDSGNLARFDRVFELADEGLDAAEANELVRYERLTRERIRLLKMLFGDDSSHVAAAMFDLASQLPDLEDRATVFREAIGGIVKSYGDQHPLHADALLGLSIALDYDDPLARVSAEKAVEIVGLIDGPDSWNYAVVLGQLGEILNLIDDAQAEQVLSQAKTIFESRNEVENTQYLECLRTLANHYRWKDRVQMALPIIERALEVSRSVANYPLLFRAELANEAANINYGLGRNDAALAHYLEALELGHEYQESCDYQMVLRNVGELLFSSNQFEDAINYLERLAVSCERSFGFCNDSCVEGCIYLAAAYRYQHEYGKAAATLRRLELLLADRDMPASSRSAGFADLEIQRLCVIRDLERFESFHARFADVWADLNVESNLDSSDAKVADDGQPASRFDALTDVDRLRIVGELLDFRNVLDDLPLLAEITAAYADAAAKSASLADWQITDARLDAAEQRQLLEMSAAERATTLEINDQLETLLVDGSIAEIEPLLEHETSLLGASHRRVLRHRSEFAWKLFQSGQLDVALSGYKNVLAARRALLSERHPSVAETQTEAAIIARNASEYEQSETWLNQAVSTLTELYGEGSPQLADALHSLALLYLSQGKAASALPPARESLELYRQRDGDSSERYAAVLHTLYGIYDKLNEDDKALTALDEAYQILQSEIDSPDSSEALSVLMSMAFATSDYSDYRTLSEKLFKRLFDVLEARGLNGTSEHARALNGYGNLLHRQGRIEAALDHYKQVLEIRERVFNSPDHRLIAQAHSQIGTTYLDLGQLMKAEKHLELAYKLRVQRLGHDSPEAVYSLYELAMTKVLLKKDAEALTLLDRSFAVEQDALLDRFLVGAGRSVSAVLAENDEKFGLLLAMHASGRAPPERVASTYAYALGRKGLALDAACRVESVGRQLRHDPEIVALYQRIGELRESLSETAITSSANPVEAEDNRRELADLKEELALAIRHSAAGLDSAKVDLTRLREEIPANGALLEFVVTKLPPLAVEPDGTVAASAGEEHLLAFLVRRDNDAIKLIDLGLAADINRDIRRLRREIEKFLDASRLSSPSRLERQYQQLGRDLYDELLGPFTADLEGVQRLMIAADGELHRIPFASLTTPNDVYLVEAMEVRYVSSGRDLLRQHAAVGAGSLVMADPDFDATTEDLENAASELQDVSRSGRPRYFASTRAGSALRWRPLAGARVEAAEVTAILSDSDYAPVRSLVGSAAVEEALKQTISPRLIHLATHGFYVSQDESGGAGSASQRAVGGSGVGRLRYAENPLMRSGLVLAGANSAVASEGESTNVDDGWVTAQEIASLDLRNTELVVLSACESGLGDVELGQGVHGLRRAFIVSGAHTLLSSLFEVPDQETRLLMTEFYRQFVETADPATALRNAQRSLISKRRSDGDSTHPFYWSSFFVLGKPIRRD